jgi:hypothetical protein
LKRCGSVFALLGTFIQIEHAYGQRVDGLLVWRFGQANLARSNASYQQQGGAGKDASGSF